MRSLCVWTTVTVLYQSLISVLIGWSTLSCQLSPSSTEFNEVTLTKLLYLYDPEACGRIQFYNYTLGRSSIVWPVKNHIAAAFRSKVTVWLSLHVIWTFFCIAHFLQGHQRFGFYAILIPFTLTGVAILLTDLVNAAIFLIDAFHTGTEARILEYIDSTDNNIHELKGSYRTSMEIDLIEDTSWISLLMVFCSLRGVVQWIVNFWIVKDNYLGGVAMYLDNQTHNTSEAIRTILSKILSIIIEAYFRTYA